MRIFTVLFLFLFLSSCSHFLGKSQQPHHSISRYITPTATAYSDLKKPYKSIYNKMPSEDHPKVNVWVKYFTGRGRSLMKTYLERSTRYFPLMRSVMREQGLPESLIYVALIESGFSAQAHSRANAVGYWQFIKGTGRRYGLRINHFVDERRDPLLSTRAATEYFKDLYSLFGSWHLALSAYNAGEYRVNRVVLSHYNRDFWYLVAKKSLPAETRNYVPKFIATKRIAENPRKFGFFKLQYQEPFAYDTVTLTKSISLKRLSENLKVDYKELRRMNPMYKGEFVPIYNDSNTIRVPYGMHGKAVAVLERSFMKQPKYAYLDHFWYRVRRGDTLSHIARRNKTSISNLKRANRLGRSSFIRVGQKIKVPTRKLATVRLKTKRAKNKPAVYKVAKGDTLFRISKRYGVAIGNIKKWNKLKNSTIHVGQALKLKEASRKVAQASNETRLHTVTRGETLIGIARKHKISLPHLMKANSLNFKSIILTGNRLVIPK